MFSFKGLGSSYSVGVDFRILIASFGNNTFTTVHGSNFKARLSIFFLPVFSFSNLPCLLEYS